MNYYNIKLTATVECSDGCGKSFTYEFPLENVRASIGDRGRIEFDWPYPNLPEGWTAGQYEGPFCPGCSEGRIR